MPDSDFVQVFVQSIIMPDTNVRRKVSVLEIKCESRHALTVHMPLKVFTRLLKVFYQVTEKPFTCDLITHRT